MPSGKGIVEHTGIFSAGTSDLPNGPADRLADLMAQSRFLGKWGGFLSLTPMFCVTLLALSTHHVALGTDSKTIQETLMVRQRCMLLNSNSYSKEKRL